VQAENPFVPIVTSPANVDVAVPRTVKLPTVRLPERYDFKAFGSNHISAVVVELEPIATTSVALFG
jgi:hypothetical protein